MTLGKILTLMAGKLCTILAVFAAAAGVFGANEVVIKDWQGVGESDGWKYSLAAPYTANQVSVAAKFNTKDSHYIQSPDLGRIIKLELSVRCSSSEATRFLEVIGYDEDGEIKETKLLSNVAKSNTLETQTVDFGAESSINSFKIMLNGTGGAVWGIASITVYSASEASDEPLILPVSGLRTTGNSRNAFTIVWDEMANTCGYEVNVWTNGLLSSGEETTVIAENFNNVSAKNNKELWSSDELAQLTDYGLWETDNVYGFPDEDGKIVLGNTSHFGGITSAPLEIAGEVRLTLTARRLTKDDTAPIAVALVRNGATNIVSTIGMSTDYGAFHDYAVDFEIVRGDKLLISNSEKSGSSTDKKYGRVALSAVRLQCGEIVYEEITVPVLEDFQVDGVSIDVATAASVNYFYSVCALYEVGGVIQKSEAAEGFIDMSAPEWMRGWLVSSFDSGVKARSFAGLVPGEWNEGNEIIVLSGDEVVTTIAQNNGNPNSRGLYITDIDAETKALTLYGTGTGAVTAVLPMRNDTDRVITETLIEWQAGQCTINNLSETELSFAYKIANDISEAYQPVGWINMDSAAATAKWNRNNAPSDWTPSMETKSVAISDIIDAGKWLLLRWQVPKEPNSAAMGISTIKATLKYKSRKFQVSIR